ncbi:putative caspase-like protein [Actinoplanes lutulentus]|nr:putative caspase-like protein [Actinoplanes lutulentus]
MATSRYQDAGLPRLRAAATDAAGLAEVLGDPVLGAFAGTVVENGSHAQISRSIDDFLSARRSVEVALIYLSGHGLLDDAGRLYFAAEDTQRDRPLSTAISWNWLTDVLDRCRATRQILILDTCYSGAAGRAKAGQDVPAAALLGGRGRVVLTASSATQMAFEGERDDGSIFTSALLDGLRDGAADRLGRGYVTVREAYDHARDLMLGRKVVQTPQINVYRGEGEIVLSRTRPRAS